MSSSSRALSRASVLLVPNDPSRRHLASQRMVRRGSRLFRNKHRECEILAVAAMMMPQQSRREVWRQVYPGCLRASRRIPLPTIRMLRNKSRWQQRSHHYESTLLRVSEPPTMAQMKASQAVERSRRHRRRNCLRNSWPTRCERRVSTTAAHQVLVRRRSAYYRILRPLQPHSHLLLPRFRATAPSLGRIHSWILRPRHSRLRQASLSWSTSLLLRVLQSPPEVERHQRRRQPRRLRQMLVLVRVECTQVLRHSQRRPRSRITCTSSLRASPAHGQTTAIRDAGGGSS